MEIEVQLNFIKKAESLIRADNRFIYMAVGGSWINKQLDEFSDLDIYLILADHFVLSIDEKKEILCNVLECYVFIKMPTTTMLQLAFFK
jgi:hypothetical protein